MEYLLHNFFIHTKVSSHAFLTAKLGCKKLRQCKDRDAVLSSFQLDLDRNPFHTACLRAPTPVSWSIAIAYS